MNEKLKQDPEFVCHSCETFLVKNSLTLIFKNPTRIQLKNYMLERDPDVREKTYVCTHCQPKLNENNIPDRCILNGLYTEPVPKELSNLNTLKKSVHSTGQMLSNGHTIGNLYWKSSYL